jgi:hypothetical protein
MTDSGDIWTGNKWGGKSVWAYSRDVGFSQLPSIIQNILGLEGDCVPPSIHGFFGGAMFTPSPGASYVPAAEPVFFLEFAFP